jgi:hypothetical protein
LKGRCRKTVFIYGTSTKATLSVVDAFDSAKKVQVTVPAGQIASILADNLAQMNRTSLIDAKSGARMDLLVDGTEFNGKSRLSVLVTGANFKFKLTNCNVKESSKASY